MSEIEVWHSEYPLRQFIDMASRWAIDAVYKNRTEQNPYSVFKHFIEEARENYELFRTQLNRKLTENENWRAIGIDLKHRFLIEIDSYINWYNEHAEELEKFEPYNPYKLMLSMIESTKMEILKYFPEFAEIQPKKISIPKEDLMFYKDIVHRLYVQKTEIGATFFHDPFDFIEAKHSEAPFKGKVFYLNLITEMAEPHWGLEVRKDFFHEVLNYCKEKIDESAVTPSNRELKANKLKQKLYKYGFLSIPKVSCLSSDGTEKLFALITGNDLPYCIAMFEFLGFITHLKNEYFKTKSILNKEISNWFNSDKDGRAVKGNISTLSEYSTEDRTKYTAHLHKEKVQNDYEKLK